MEEKQNMITFTSIRHYNVKPDSTSEIIKRAEKGFLPIVSKAPGFVSYDLVDTGKDTVTTISTFENQAGADNSNKLAESWVNENLTSFLTSPPMIMSGRVGIHQAR
jgi:hypothetical protein